MKHLIMIGAGGFGRECYWHAKSSIGYGEEFDLKGYLDDTPEGILREDLLRIPRIGTIDNYEIQDDDVFACTIGDPQGKSKIVNKIKNRGGKFINLIHKSVSLAAVREFGNGLVLCCDTGFSDNVTIKDFVTVNASTTVGHDSVIGNFSSIMSRVNICGNVQIGERTYIATSAVLIPNAKVEDDAFVGAGTVVLKRVRKGKKVFGNPAMYLPD